MQGPSRLYAYIKKSGYDVCFKEFNQNAYFKLLSKAYLSETIEKASTLLGPATRSKSFQRRIGSILLNSSNNALRQLLIEAPLLDSSWQNIVKSNKPIKKSIYGIANFRINRFNIFRMLLSNSEYLISEIEQARQILDQNFFNLPADEFLKQFRILLCGKALIDAVYFPAQLSFGFGLHGMCYRDRPSVTDIINALNNERCNFLIQYYRNEVIPALGQEQPSIVGISISHTSELIPAFTLAHLIKSAQPQIHICLGGVVLTELAYRICKNAPLWNFFDSLILGPGEYAFSQLIEQIEKSADLSKVPNLIYKNKEDVIIKSEASHEFDLNNASTPEYPSLRPRIPLPLETASGCYWGKCVFCRDRSDFNPKQKKTRIRNIELVLEDIRKLQDSYNPLYIGITDSALHPRRIEQIVDYNLSNDKQVNFLAYIRFEKEFKSLTFCEKLAQGGFSGGQVGLESGSQRVNDKINKGVSLKDVPIILNNFHRVGILVHLYTIVGSPIETIKDALLTFNFVKRWHHLLKLGWQIYPFRALELTALAERAQEFGLHTTPLPSDFLAQWMTYDMQDGLSQKESLALSVKFTKKLKRYLKPIHQIMDIQMYKAFILAQELQMENKIKESQRSPKRDHEKRTYLDAGKDAVTH
jgi:hypothetical protein